MTAQFPLRYKLHYIARQAIKGGGKGGGGASAYTGFNYTYSAMYYISNKTVTNVLWSSMCNDRKDIATYQYNGRYGVTCDPQFPGMAVS